MFTSLRGATATKQSRGRASDSWIASPSARNDGREFIYRPADRNNSNGASEVPSPRRRRHNDADGLLLLLAALLRPLGPFRFGVLNGFPNRVRRRRHRNVID